MTIDELSAAVHEDLNGLIVSAHLNDRQLVVAYECDHWSDHDMRVSFILRCLDVVESTVAPAASSELHWSDSHPVLLDHNSKHGTLYFTSAPVTPHEVIGRLYEAHERFYRGWRQLREHVNACGDTAAVLRTGTGMLAKGPISLLREYQAAVGGLMTTNVVESARPVGEYRALLFDESFAVCRQVHVETAG